MLKQGDRKIGRVVIGEVRKNKEAGTEGLELEGQLIIGSGFSAIADLLGDCMDAGVITKRGITYYFGEEKLGIGLTKVRQRIESDTALADLLRDAYGKAKESA